MNIYEQLISQGYYVGSSFDIFSEGELVDLENKISNVMPTSELGQTKWLRFVTAQFPHDKKLEETNKFIPLNELEDRLKFIKDNNGIIDQQWYFSDICALHIPNFDGTIYINRVADFIGKIYNIDRKYINARPLNVTHYAKDDFIDQHRDGRNAKRLCAFLLYFGDPKSYKKEYGGRLFVSNKKIFNYNDYSLYDNHFISVEPVRPNYVILDFTKHNVIHAVEKCFTDFNRFTLLCFPTQETGPSNL